MDDIHHANPPIFGIKEMLMMPKAIRTKALFINKKFFVLDMRNFGNPSNPKEWVNRNFVLDDLPRKHLAALTSIKNFEVQFRWSNKGQVIGRAKKVPGLVKGGWYPRSSR